MLRLAGEIADGVMLWLCNPEYIRRVVVPEVTAGRERAGKGLEGFDIVAAVPAAVTDDRAGAFETMRGDLITYWSLPFYRAMIERSGFGAEIAAFDAGMKAGDLDKAKEGITDDFLEALTAIGTPDEVRAGVDALPRRRSHEPLHRPGTKDGLRGDARSSRPRPADCRLPTADGELNFSGAFAPPALR